MALFELTELASFVQQDLDTATATVARDIGTGAVTSYTNQLFEEATYTHTLPTRYDTLIVLPQRPVTAVASVTTPDDGLLDAADWSWDGATPTVNLTTARADMATVVYTAGYVVIPAAVKAVALTVAARQYVNAAALRSEAIDDYQVTYAIPEATLGLTANERRVLDRWRITTGTVIAT